MKQTNFTLTFTSLKTAVTGGDVCASAFLSSPFGRWTGTIPGANSVPVSTCHTAGLPW